MNWYEILKGLYERGKIDLARLENAVAKGLITEEEKLLIIGDDRNE